MTTKKKSESKELTVTEPNNLALSFGNLALSVLSQRQFEILTEKVPPHALKKREDGYEYVASGWIKKKLFEAFGMDWDWQIVPIEGDKLYSLRERDEGKNNSKLTQYVAVTGVLTVRVRDPQTLKIISTITKTGIGSQVWRAKMELGDCIKGAKTDALRNAAFDLGIGFNYKWDDEIEQEKYEKAQEILNGIKSEPIENPKTIVEFLAWSSNEGVEYPELLRILNVQVVTDISDFAEAMAKVKSARGQ